MGDRILQLKPADLPNEAMGSHKREQVAKTGNKTLRDDLLLSPKLSFHLRRSRPPKRN